MPTAKLVGICSTTKFSNHRKESENIPETVEMTDDVRLPVVVEGKPPTYYGCGQSGTLK